MLDLIIKGGQVVTSWGVGDWEIAVQGDKIVGVGAPGTFTEEAGRVIDASGKIVVPGGIEPHAHIAAPFVAQGQNLSTAPPEQVSRAALFGGTTTLLDFAVQNPGIDVNQAIAERTSVWQGNSYADYSHHLMLSGEIDSNIMGQVREAVEEGFASVKIFTTNVRPPTTPGPGRMVRMGHLHDLMELIQRHGAMLLVHSEDDDMVMNMYRKLGEEERTVWWNMPLVHNNESEDVSFRRVLNVAGWTGSPVYFVHVSARQGVQAIGESRAKGMPVYGETLHNYCCFNSDNYREENGMKYHTYPSLKSEEDRLSLWNGIVQWRPQHHGHRRVLHILGGQDCRENHIRRDRRTQRGRDPHGNHVQRGGFQARNDAAAVCGRNIGQRRQNHGPVPTQRGHRPRQRCRYRPYRPKYQENTSHGRLPHH